MIGNTISLWNSSPVNNYNYFIKVSPKVYQMQTGRDINKVGMILAINPAVTIIQKVKRETEGIQWKQVMTISKSTDFVKL